MTSLEHAQIMAPYNAWQNRSLYAAADSLSDDDRKADRGAHFGSIFATLNHLLWGDRIWMSRFAGTPPPEGGIPSSTDLYEDWGALRAARLEFDAVIENWTRDLTEDWLGGDITWFSGAAQREFTKPAWLLLTHLFNHQTHHRGQVHAMLTAAGAKPEDTDLFLMPES